MNMVLKQPAFETGSQSNPCYSYSREVLCLSTDIFGVAEKDAQISLTWS